MMDFDAKISGAWNALWLAAHWEKKLKKADYMHANVDEMISDILLNKADVSLRQHGHLLLGATRVLLKKIMYQEQRVTATEEQMFDCLVSGDTRAGARGIAGGGNAANMKQVDPNNVLDLDEEMLEQLEDPDCINLISRAAAKRRKKASAAYFRDFDFGGAETQARWEEITLACDYHESPMGKRRRVIPDSTPEDASRIAEEGFGNATPEEIASLMFLESGFLNEDDDAQMLSPNSAQRAARDRAKKLKERSSSSSKNRSIEQLRGGEYGSNYDVEAEAEQPPQSIMGSSGAAAELYRQAQQKSPFPFGRASAGAMSAGLGDERGTAGDEQGVCGASGGPHDRSIALEAEFVERMSPLDRSLLLEHLEHAGEISAGDAALLERSLRLDIGSIPALDVNLGVVSPSANRGKRPISLQTDDGVEIIEGGEGDEKGRLDGNRHSGTSAATSAGETDLEGMMLLPDGRTSRGPLAGAAGKSAGAAHGLFDDPEDNALQQLRDGPFRPEMGMPDIQVPSIFQDPRKTTAGLLAVPRESYAFPKKPDSAPEQGFLQRQAPHRNTDFDVDLDEDMEMHELEEPQFAPDDDPGFDDQRRASNAQAAGGGASNVDEAGTRRVTGTTAEVDGGPRPSAPAASRGASSGAAGGEAPSFGEVNLGPPSSKGGVSNESAEIRLTPLEALILSNNRLSPEEKRAYLSSIRSPKILQSGAQEPVGVAADVELNSANHHAADADPSKGRGAPAFDGLVRAGSDKGELHVVGLNDPNLLTPRPRSGFGDGGQSLLEDEAAKFLGDSGVGRGVDGGGFDDFSAGSADDFDGLVVQGRGNLAAYEISDRNVQRRKLAERFAGGAPGAGAGVAAGVAVPDNNEDENMLPCRPAGISNLSGRRAGALNTPIMSPNEKLLQQLASGAIDKIESGSRTPRERGHMTPSQLVDELLAARRQELELSGNRIGGGSRMNTPGYAIDFHVGEGGYSEERSRAAGDDFNTDERDAGRTSVRGRRFLSQSSPLPTNILDDDGGLCEDIGAPGEIPNPNLSFEIPSNGEKLSQSMLRLQQRNANGNQQDRLLDSGEQRRQSALRPHPNPFQTVRKFQTPNLFGDYNPEEDGAPQRPPPKISPVTGLPMEESGLASIKRPGGGAQADTVDPKAGLQLQLQPKSRVPKRNRQLERQQERALKSNAKLTLSDAEMKKSMDNRHKITTDLMVVPEIPISLPLDVRGLLCPTLMPACFDKMSCDVLFLSSASRRSVLAQELLGAVASSSSASGGGAAGKAGTPGARRKTPGRRGKNKKVHFEDHPDAGAVEENKCQPIAFPGVDFRMQRRLHALDHPEQYVCADAIGKRSFEGWWQGFVEGNPPKQLHELEMEPGTGEAGLRLAGLDAANAGGYMDMDVDQESYVEVYDDAVNPYGQPDQLQQAGNVQNEADGAASGSSRNIHFYQEAGEVGSLGARSGISDMFGDLQNVIGPGSEIGSQVPHEQDFAAASQALQPPASQEQNRFDFAFSPSNLAFAPGLEHHSSRGGQEHAHQTPGSAAAEAVDHSTGVLLQGMGGAEPGSQPVVPLSQREQQRMLFSARVFRPDQDLAASQGGVSIFDLDNEIGSAAGANPNFLLSSGCSLDSKKSRRRQRMSALSAIPAASSVRGRRQMQSPVFSDLSLKSQDAEQIAAINKSAAKQIESAMFAANEFAPGSSAMGEQGSSFIPGAAEDAVGNTPDLNLLSNDGIDRAGPARASGGFSAEMIPGSGIASAPASAALHLYESGRAGGSVVDSAAVRGSSASEDPARRQAEDAVLLRESLENQQRQFIIRRRTATPSNGDEQSQSQLQHEIAAGADPVGEMDRQFLLQQQERHRGAGIAPPMPRRRATSSAVPPHMLAEGPGNRIRQSEAHSCDAEFDRPLSPFSDGEDEEQQRNPRLPPRRTDDPNDAYGSHLPAVDAQHEEPQQFQFPSPEVAMNEDGSFEFGSGGSAARSRVAIKLAHSRRHGVNVAGVASPAKSVANAKSCRGGELRPPHGSRSRAGDVLSGAGDAAENNFDYEEQQFDDGAGDMMNIGGTTPSAPGLAFGSDLGDPRSRSTPSSLQLPPLKKPDEPPQHGNRLRKELQRAVATNHDAPDSCVVHLDDLLENVDDVALAFYELLELRTEGEVKVEQEEPYGDIRIQMAVGA